MVIILPYMSKLFGRPILFALACALGLPLAPAAAAPPDAAQADAARATVRAALTNPDAAVPPMAVWWLQRHALAQPEPALAKLTAELTHRVDTALDDRAASDALRLLLWAGQAALETVGARAQADRLAAAVIAEPVVADEATLADQVIILWALAEAGATLDVDEWLAAAAARAPELLGDGQTLLPDMRQEPYATALLALARLQAAGQPVDALLTNLHAAHDAAYGLADGTYERRPDGPRSVRDGRALAGNPAMALAYLTLGDRDAAERVLEATADQTADDPRHAGWWLAAELYTAGDDGAGAAAGGAAVPVVATAQTPEVALRATLAPAAADGTAQLDLAVTMTAPWHIYAHEPESAIVTPTVVTITPPEGGEVLGIDYPAGIDFVFAGEPCLVYADTVTIPARVKLPAGGGPVQAALRFQACDDNSCLRPTTLRVELTP